MAYCINLTDAHNLSSTAELHLAFIKFCNHNILINVANIRLFFFYQSALSPELTILNVSKREK